MKKFLFIVAAVVASTGAIAQGKGNGKGHKQGKKYEHQNRNNRDDDRYERNNQTVNDRIFRRNDDNNSQGGKYTNNAPRKVRDAFYNDYPNASNISWTKDRGVWTARFNQGGIFGGGNAVSYKANGQRVGTYNDNTVYRRDRNRNTGSTQNGPTVWDKVFGRRQ